MPRRPLLVVLLLLAGLAGGFLFWREQRHRMSSIIDATPVPGAVMIAAKWTGLAALVLWGAGWSLASGIVFGLAVSVASTVVLMRALMDHGWLQTPEGKVSLGWLVFEDLLTVAILVLIPGMAAPSGDSSLLVTASWAVGKAVLFVALMIFVGNKVVPAVMNRVVNTRSRELFVLMALTVAAGTALAYVFTYLMPKIALVQQEITELQGPFSGFLRQQAYLLALIGLLTLFAVDKAAARLLRETGRTLTRGLLLQIAIYGIYSVQLGYLLASVRQHDVATYVVAAAILGAHLMGIDHHIAHRHPIAFAAVLRWMSFSEITCTPIGCRSGGSSKRVAVTTTGSPTVTGSSAACAQ